ncbi:YceI family protein [Chitinophagaceae bacterium 26-R-25]|nr:YceI family protein [Chitinophagaceae bacterium 26-R-25]
MQTAAITTKTNWVIDPIHSQIGFKVKHLMFTNVRGSFKNYTAAISTVGNNLATAEIHLIIDAASINTNDDQRDGHLRSADFFDVSNFKEITFKSIDLEREGNVGNNYVLRGDLTMKGVTRPVKMYVEFGNVMKDPWGNEKAPVHIEGKINRKDWGLAWNAPLEAGGVLVGEDVAIDIDIQLGKQQ